MVKATQEQQEEIENLKVKANKVDKLEKELIMLKKLVNELTQTTTTSTRVIGKNVSSIKCFPNPSTGSIDIQIKNTDGKHINVSVLNMLSELLSQQNGSELDFQRKFDLSNQPNGSYLVRTVIGEHVFQNKVIIQNNFSSCKRLTKKGVSFILKAV